MSSGSCSESTSGGLRPKIKTTRGNSNSVSARSAQAVDGNPLDRLTEIILSWNVLDNVVADGNRKGFESDKHWQLDGIEVDVLPDVYRTYDEYVAAWEPVMIKELQDGIVSKFSSTIETALCGTFQCTVGTHRSPEAPLQHLESSFNCDGSFGINSNGSDGGRRDRYSTPGIMDLLLISLEPLDLFPSSSTAPNHQQHQQQKQQSDRTISPEKVKAQKVALGLLVANNTATALNHSSAGRSSQIMVRSDAWQVLKDNCLDKHISTYTASSKGKSSGRMQSNAPVGKVKSYKLHYMVVEGLRSSWREFQALHDLALNIPLIGDILGAERSFAMASTPPHAAESHSQSQSQSLLAEEENALFGASPRGATEEGSYISEGSLVLFNSSQKSTASGAQVGSNDAVLPATYSDTFSSAESNCSQNESKRGTFGANNRTETINQLVASWKMKGCTEKFMKYLRLKFNPSQLHAIHTAVDQQGFTLVQGPPGTGKTSTILGILNAIHIREYNQYYKLALDAVLGAEGQKCRLQVYEHPWLNLIARLTQSKPRILVVAPSNTAVDNIILRVMEHGFVDGNGGKYFPNILRLGAGGKNPNPKIKSVTLEDLVDKEIAASDQSSNRLDALEQLNTKITAMIKDVAFLQSMLVNLQLAYAQCRLPKDFELRVDAKSGLPYWVDHFSKSTSTTSPEPKVVEVRGVNKHFTTIESLPDYTVFSHKLTQLLGSLDNVSAKRNKLHTITNMTEAVGNINVRDLAERSLIDSAHILFTTLNSAGHPSMESTEFCVTVVDEAAQSVEPSVLIALRRGCRQCIMVGDQQQLPATVFSTQARAARYDRSLFQRLIETGHPYIMLDTQYRMCPQISAFPSRMFYKNQLKDGENVTQPTYLPPFLSPISSDASRTPSPYPVQRPPFTPFMFLDLQSSREKTGASGSQSNIEEVRMCITLIKALIAAGEQAGCASIGSIGVISFYSDQVNLLRSKVHAQNFTGRPASTSVSSSHSAQGGGRPATPSSSSLVEEIDMNTVDGFQGKENDIIIISAVRANDTGTVGFLSDLRRLNVGLTRARKGLFVIGHAATLRRNRLWRELIDHAEAQKVLVSVPHPNVDLASVLQYHRQRNEPRAENRPGSGGYSNASKAEWGGQKQQDPRDLHNEYVPYSGVHSSFAGPNDGTNPNSQNNYTSTNTTADSQASRSNDRNFVVSDTSVGWVNDAPGNFSGEFSNTLSGEFSPTISSHSSRRPPPPPGPPPPAKRPVLHAISSSYASSHSSKDRDYSLADAQHFHQTQQHAQLGTLGYDTSRAFPSVATSAAFGAPQSSAGSNPSSRQSSRPGSRFGNIASLEETAPAPPDAAGEPTGTGRVQQLGSTSTRGLLSSSSSGASATIHKRKANVLVVEELEEGEVIDLT